MRKTFSFIFEINMSLVYGLHLPEIPYLHWIEGLVTIIEFFLSKNESNIPLTLSQEWWVLSHKHLSIPKKNSNTFIIPDLWKVSWRNSASFLPISLPWKEALRKFHKWFREHPDKFQLGCQDFAVLVLEAHYWMKHRSLTLVHRLLR